MTQRERLTFNSQGSGPLATFFAAVLSIIAIAGGILLGGIVLIGGLILAAALMIVFFIARPFLRRRFEKKVKEFQEEYERQTGQSPQAGPSGKGPVIDGEFEEVDRR